MLKLFGPFCKTLTSGAVHLKAVLLYEELYKLVA